MCDQGRLRQVLIERNDRPEPDTISNLMEQKLMKKVNMMIELMGLEAADRPEQGEMFIGVQKLCRGGVLYLLTLEKATEWLQELVVKNSFMRYYRGSRHMKDKGYDLILEFMSIQFQPDLVRSREIVEDINRMG